MAQFTTIQGVRSGGGGPEGPTLEQRVSHLERDMSRVLTMLERLEPKIIEQHARGATQADVFALKADIAAVKSDIARIDGRLDGLEKRFAMIPTTWQTISIVAGLMLGITGILFAAGRFLRP